MADGVDAVRAAPFPVVDPERIPTKRYYDEEFYRAENERLWPHAWQMACRLEQVQNVGDYIEYTILGKSVVIVGDTPHDIACGEHLGVRTLAVATGSYTTDELAACAPDHLFPDLADIDAAWSAIFD